MNERVSIIVPIYNVEQYIRQCLDSIIHQSYQNIEIILIDDGSPDCCGAICDKYAAIDKRIKVIHRENAGVSVARNEGMERATGEWIMFVDPDDWLELDCCEKAIQAAQISGCDIVYFQRDERDNDGSLVQIYPERPTGFLNEKELRNIQFYICTGDAESAGFESATPWGKLYRRTFLMEHKCRFPVGIRKRQDVIFNLECLTNLKSAYYLDYTGYHYRNNNKSICHKYNPDMLFIMTDFLKELNRFITEKFDRDMKYEKAYGKHILICIKEIENVYYFHPSHFVTLYTYKNDIKYLFDSVNADYFLSKCKVADMRTSGERVSFYLLSRHHWSTYYCLKYIKRKVSCSHYLKGNKEEYDSEANNPSCG